MRMIMHNYADLVSVDILAQLVFTVAMKLMTFCQHVGNDGGIREPSRIFQGLLFWARLVRRSARPHLAVAAEHLAQG